MPIDMKAVILAAGQGSRLRPAKPGVPKCLLEVGGKTLIEHQLAVIDAQGIRDVVAVVGYKNELIKRHLGDRVRYRICDTWDSSNNFQTLWDVRDELRGGFVCFFADVYCDAGPIEEALLSPYDICAVVDTSQVLAGTMRVRIVNGRLVGIGGHIPVRDGSGNFIGIAKFSTDGARRLLEQMEAMAGSSRNDYYTVAVDRLAGKGEDIGFVTVDGRPWVEIDTAEDLERAHTLLALGSRQ
ncbi:MAG: phosphocholine cytidylyltransferase family protein [Vicinamibacterales bacterium]|nr:phosphocholine cytidylyltransferase family protein [Vicinamibacterales bacterium]